MITPHDVVTQLRAATDRGDAFVTCALTDGPIGVEVIAAVAELNHWHVKAVWRGEAATTYILLRFVAP